MEQKPILYISGAVTGVDNYLALFNHAEQMLLQAGFPVCNPVQLCQPHWTWEHCMKTVLQAMLDCDALALLDNWEKSKGANIEVRIAKELNMPVKLVSEWKNNSVNL